MANYRVNTNTNNSNEAKQGQKKKTRKQRKVDQLRLFKLKHDLLKISEDLKTAFAADTYLAEGQ
jgi:hypothetical protein